MDAMTIAVDLAKHVFEVAIETPAGQVTSRRRLTRAQFARLLQTAAPAQVLMEACATAHYWGRTAQAAGHQVSLLPPHYVRPFVRRQKTDRTDVTGLLDAHRSGMSSVFKATDPMQGQQLLLRHGFHRDRAHAAAVRIQ